MKAQERFYSFVLNNTIIFFYHVYFYHVTSFKKTLNGVTD